MDDQYFYRFSTQRNEAMTARLPIQHFYAIPVRGVTVTHRGNAIHIHYPASVHCDIIFRSNLEGDITLPLLYTAAIKYDIAHYADQPLQIRTRARGAGWLGAHTELSDQIMLPVAELTTIETPVDAFRLCQDELLADHLRWDWCAETPGEIIIHGIHLCESTADAYFAPRVDRYGQSLITSWPGKVYGDDELLADSLAPLPSPLASRDRFGGWLEGKAFAKGSSFRLENEDDHWWLVTPDGHPFLSFGSTCVSPGTANTRVAGREELFDDLPPHEGDYQACWTSEFHHRPEDCELFSAEAYACGQDVVSFYTANLIRKYGERWRERWIETSAARLRSWGMNSLANWSDIACAQRAQMPYVLQADRVAPPDFTGMLADKHDDIFSLRQTPDVFHHEFASRIATAFTPLTQFAEDPYLLGYFVQNEENWCQWHSPFALPWHWESRQTFFTELQEQYGTIDRLNSAWGTGFRSFTHLAHYRQEANPPGLSPRGSNDCDAFLRRFTERYFSHVRAALKSADPNHLFWGCRFLAMRPHQAILDGCAPYLDVLSINWYMWHHQTLEDIPAFLSAWYNAVKRPIVITEYSFDLTDERLLGGRWLSPDASVRAELSHDFTEACLDLPFVVGCHWFQFIDEMVTGRDLDGERQGFGLVDVTDRPHADLVAALREVGQNMYPRHARTLTEILSEMD